MDFPQSRAVVPRFEVLDQIDSTNDELVRRASGPDAAPWPDLAVIVTDNQLSGRGRLGRSWSTPRGTSLAISVLLRPPATGRHLSADRFGWIPLLAGLAMTRAVRSLGPAATLKWPNDVLIDGKKVCGILCELLPAADGVVVGAGLNVAIRPQNLPVDMATSLLIAGVAEPDPDAALAAFLTELTALYRAFVAADADPQASGLAREVAAACDTIGRAVRVQLPTATPLEGTATGIDGLGRLVVDTNGRLTAVAAGDVTHLRY